MDMEKREIVFITGISITAFFMTFYAINLLLIEAQKIIAGLL